MVAVNAALRQKIAEAYVSHRLNHGELVAVTQKLKMAEAGRGSAVETRHLLKELSDVHCDQRMEYSPGDLKQALGYLRLDQQMARLRDDEAWTPFQRALYRRLSDLDHDPVPRSAQGDGTGSPGFVESCLENFSRWDRDGDGTLTPVELDGALADPALVGADVAAAVVLRRQGVNLEKCVEDAELGVTRADLSQFLIGGIPENSVGTYKVNHGFGKMMQEADMLRAAPPLLAENFDPELAEQGRAGACVMLSTLASKPAEEVKAMFRPLPEGKVAVQFADGETQVVRDLTLAERVYHAKSPEGGRWPGLLEVAIGQRLHARQPASDGSFRSAANSIAPEEASLALHGSKTRKVSIDKLTPDQVRNLLIKTARGPKPWLAGSRATLKGQDSVVSVEDLHNGIANNHAYAISGFDQDLDLVWLRNPWRHGEWVVNFDHKDDGVFAMPLRDFYSSYRWVGAPGGGVL